jgi:hypothetical protein
MAGRLRATGAATPMWAPSEAPADSVAADLSVSAVSLQQLSAATRGAAPRAQHPCSLAAASPAREVVAGKQGQVAAMLTRVTSSAVTTSGLRTILTIFPNAGGVPTRAATIRRFLPVRPRKKCAIGKIEAQLGRAR